MIDIIEQELRANEDREIALAKRDERIDAATDYAMTKISAVELQSVFDEIDVSKVDFCATQLRIPEHKFALIQSIIQRNGRMRRCGYSSVDNEEIGKLFIELVWMQHRTHQIEPVYEDE